MLYPTYEVEKKRIIWVMLIGQVAFHRWLLKCRENEIRRGTTQYRENECLINIVNDLKIKQWHSVKDVDIWTWS